MKKVGIMSLANRERARARGAAAFLSAVLVLGLVVTLTSFGSTGRAIAQTASPSPSAGGSTEPTVVLLNPSTAYDPGLTETGDPDPPKISDKNDGFDTAYRFYAATKNLPANALLEVSVIPPSLVPNIPGQEITVGTMTPVPGAPDAWEVFWEIPNSVPDGPATVTVRLFAQSALGFEEVANDTVEAEIEQHESGDNPTDTQQADEAITLTRPVESGTVGFYKGRNGAWRGLVTGTASQHTNRVAFEYSTTPVGKDPVFKICVNAAPGAVRPDQGNTRAVSAYCVLQGKDTPSQVTTFAAVTEETDTENHQAPDPLLGGAPPRTQDSADVRLAHFYPLLDPSQLRLELIPTASGSALAGRVEAGLNPALEAACLGWAINVFDDQGKLVRGVNIDVHASGPTDQLQFAIDNPDPNIFVDSVSDSKAPDKGGHGTRDEINCFQGMDAGRSSGVTHIPGASDIMHIESIAGTSLDGGDAGQWFFDMYSPDAGFTNVTAWIDDEPLTLETENRPADNDVLEPGEPSATSLGQWLPAPITAAIDPPGVTSQPGVCVPYTFRVRTGNKAVPGINVDVHAQGPGDAVSFCDPVGGSAHRAPNDGDHTPQNSSQAADASTSPPTHHTEGETDDAGNFVVGLSSTTAGDTALTAWVDGEKGSDNDVPDDDEVIANASASWADCTQAPHVSFVNPSAYGGETEGDGRGTRVSNVLDADRNYHIVTRTDCPDQIQGIQLQLGSGTGSSFAKSADIGSAVRVGGTDAFEMLWPVNVSEGDYTLRAVGGSGAIAEQEITVNNSSADPPNPNDIQDETVELTRPLDGALAPFTKGSTTIGGIASAGAEGLDLYYSRVAPKDTPQEADWINCGFVQLDGTGSDPQTFQGTCSLRSPDQAVDVKAVAAIVYNCVQDGCDAAPDANDPGPRNPGSKNSGDAHRVIGLDSNPIIALLPAENENNLSTCTKFAVNVLDGTGQPLPNQNVDVHLTGPSDSPDFCDPPNATATPRQAPDQGGHTVAPERPDQGYHGDAGGLDTQHTEGKSTPSGKFVFGVSSEAVGDSEIAAWVDGNDNDVLDSGEVVDSAVMHWVSKTAKCSLNGTTGPDRLRGTPNADRICGFGGHDTINGLGGDDVIVGGRSPDTITGGGGNDVIKGGNGGDRMRGRNGKDRIVGGKGNDVINGGKGRDTCSGGLGRDRFRSCERGATGTHAAQMLL